MDLQSADYCSIASAEDSDHATRVVRELAIRFGFSRLDANLLASAASELTMNIARHASHGQMQVKKTRNERGLEIIVSDDGPGIIDIEMAMLKGYSTKPDGLGVGLPAAKLAVDEFEIDSCVGVGTKIYLRHYLKLPSSRFTNAAVTRADPAYTCNGDLVFRKTLQGDTQLLAVIDGMGQGEDARKSALIARDALDNSSSTSPCKLAEQAHLAVKESATDRGFAMALIVTNGKDLRLVTVGDVSCRLFSVNEGIESHRFFEKPGILGSDMPIKFVEQQVNLLTLPMPVLVLMASDGVSPNFEANGEPIHGDLVDIVHTVLEKFRRAHGDATVAALRINQ